MVDSNVNGLMFQLGNIMRIDNGFVEESVCFNTAGGYIVVSYNDTSMGRNNRQQVRLNINRNTKIINFRGKNLCTCCIQEGMWINAIFSGAMTRSIPPQANAFLIIVQGRSQQPVSSVTIDRIASIDLENSSFYTGNRNDINSQTRFIVNNNTVITDREGNRIRLRNLRPGQLVRINHANFQTASIPPQTTAFSVQVLQ